MMRLISFALLAFTPGAGAASAASWSFSLTQPDGHPTGVNQQLFGDPGYNYAVAMIPGSGEFVTVVDQSNGNIMYAELDEDGYFVPSTYKVGDDISESNLQPNLRESAPAIDARCDANAYCTWKKNANGLSNLSPPKGDYKNLVLPFRFSDHTNRDLNIDRLAYDSFNDDDISVRDFFQTQSFGTITMFNIFADPVDISKTESYCADNMSGTSRKIVDECLSEVIGKNDGANFDDFNIITFIHSGHGAEFGGRDRESVYFDDRIWSHSWAIDIDGKEKRYALMSAFYGRTDFQIQPVGIPVHEIGQAIGAPTLYGPLPGNGLGYYDPLASPYGFDGNLRHPGSLSAFTRVFLEWADVQEITENGEFTIKPSTETNTVYKISKGLSQDEYLYIEYRVNHGYDLGLRGPGLAIYHVDETATDITSYPGDPSYPTNHCRVCLIQADNRFDLERMEDHGDTSDLFNPTRLNGVAVNGITPLGPLVDGALYSAMEPHPGYPNTKGYSGGKFSDSGITIKDISTTGTAMKFTVEFAEKNLS